MTSDTVHRLAAVLADRYHIERELGAGGMATVYLAHDLKHDRQVAIKVLHPHLAAMLGAERFLKEIKTTANLQHPHILPLFDSGDADGLLFYVMPFVGGESLRERLTREQRLPVADAVRITAEVASALDYAHRHGVIHRDIKPENILLHEGSALVADFGIALASSGGDSRLTEVGMSLGTPSYMSPEQALGERELDARSDIYAVGAMLYEMLTGTPPFSGPSARVIVAKVLTEKPVPPSRLRKDLPAHVEAAVLTALEKDPANRFATAAALQHAVERAGPARSRLPRVSRRQALAAAVVIVALAAATYVASHRGGSGSSSAGTPPRTLAVLPFENKSGDSSNTVFFDGLRDEIKTALTRLPGLTVYDASGRRFRDPNVDITSVGHELGAEAVLTGVLRPANAMVRLNVELQDAPTKKIRLQQDYASRQEDLYRLEDSFVVSIARAVGLSLTPAQLAASIPGRTANPAAHKLLLEANGYAEQRRPKSLERAMQLFDKVIKLDTAYADAWAGLANAQNLRAVFGDSFPKPYFVLAKLNAKRALQLDSNSAYAHTTYGFTKQFYDRDYPGAGAEFARAIRLDPNQASTWLYQAWYYLAMNHIDSALRSIRQGKKLDPGAAIIRIRLGTTLYYADSLKEAENELDSVLARDPANPLARNMLALVYADDGQCRAALTLVPPADSFPTGGAEALMGMSTRARCGKILEVRDYVRAMEARARSGQYVDPFYFAAVYGALHEKENAFRWLQRAVEGNAWGLMQLRGNPAFKEYRSLPAFQNLVRKALPM